MTYCYGYFTTPSIEAARQWVSDFHPEWMNVEFELMDDSVKITYSVRK